MEPTFLSFCPSKLSAISYFILFYSEHVNFQAQVICMTEKKAVTMKSKLHLQG